MTAVSLDRYFKICYLAYGKLKPIYNFSLDVLKFGLQGSHSAVRQCLNISILE